MISDLHGSKIGNKVIPMDYVVVRIGEVFMLDVTMPFNEIKGDTQVQKLKNLEGTIWIWNSQFFKLVRPQQGNQ
jgi:hypothetical protein